MKKHIYRLMASLLIVTTMMSVTACSNQEIKSEVTIKEINYPIKQGELLGVIKYYDSNGNELGKLNIVSKNNLDEISFKNKMKILLKKYGF